MNINVQLKAEKRTFVRFSAAPPPRGIQLDVALAGTSTTDDRHRFSAAMLIGSTESDAHADHQ